MNKTATMSIDEVLNLLDQSTDPVEIGAALDRQKELETISKAEANQLKQARAARLAAEFEQKKKAHEADIEKFNVLVKELDSGEDELLQAAIDFVKKAEARIELFNKTRKLESQINRDHYTFETDSVALEEINMYDSLRLTWREFPKGILQRVIDHMGRNKKYADHPTRQKPLTLENIKHSTYGG